MVYFKDYSSVSGSPSSLIWHPCAIQAIQAYLATISFLDAQVGRVLDALEETGLKENTIILLTSDLGYHM